MSRGKVYLVGAGPGDPELLTLKGLRALQEADLVVYDRLANPALLDLARPEAERMFVGKEPQCHAVPQGDINALLVEAALAGKVVCRLKGGDPFVFGRGGEEALSLARAGVLWEYVPGVSSAIAVPGYAGIPVTHRGLGTAFTIITGHADPTDVTSLDRWRAQVQGSDTLVFLMGVERLSLLVQRLLEAGKDPGATAAVISWGTYPRQKTVCGPLSELAHLAAAAGIEAPAITLVGEVAALREELRWFDAGPLFGRRILVTRPADQAGSLLQLLAHRGAEAIPCAAIRTVALSSDLTLLDQPYDWVVFTSVNGIRFLAERLRDAGRDVRALGRAAIAAIGPSTAAAVEAAGLHVDFVPPSFIAESLLKHFPVSLSGRRILIARAREARDVLPEGWRAAGAEVTVLPVYETRTDTASGGEAADRLRRGEVDAVTFTSSSTVRSFMDLMTGRGLAREQLGAVPAACIGPVTAETARQAGLRVEVVSGIHTTEGLVAALEAYFSTDAVT